MLTRIVTALVLIPILVAVLIFSHTVVFPIAFALLAAAAVFELLRALGLSRDALISAPAYLIALGLPFAVYLIEPFSKLALLFFGVYVFYLLWLFTVAVLRRGALAFASVASAFVGTLYLTFSFASVSLLRFGVEHGASIYLLIFIGPWVTDTFAYFTGRFFGRHKLIPEISPKKTVEGAIGGTLFCILAFAIFGVIMQRAYGNEVNYAVLMVSGFLTALVSQVGDLIASLIKREHGVKDYGSIFPGHGGILDRFDSVLAVAPLLFCLASVGGPLSFIF